MTAPPITLSDFAPGLDALGPFEARPELAVAVSGGADSLALTLLADAWARERGGRAVGLTVDHRLRPEAAEEARVVGRTLKRHGIEHHVLVWDGPKPASGIQAAARDARYRLMEAWCREQGLLHLLLGHHRDDQAETVALRRRAGSGRDGLAGMAAVHERPGVRLLRPLLGVPGARLRETLNERGETWIEDPSNRDARFARVRLRAVLDEVERDALAGTARRAATERRDRERAVWRLTAEVCDLHPAGHALLDGVRLAAAPGDLAERALATVVRTVGGREWPPRRERVARVLEALALSPRDLRATLGACRILPSGGRLLVCREARGLPASRPVKAGDGFPWDGRFEIRVDGPDGLESALAAFGNRGGGVPEGFPKAARAVLPALFDEDGVSARPLLGYKRENAGALKARVRFRPRANLSGTGFCVA